MSMTVTANGQMAGKSDRSSALAWNHRALRLPVAVSLALHASVFAGVLFWWQASGAPAPKGLPEGLSVTFVELSSPPPAPAAPQVMAAPVEPKPVVEPEPEPVVEKTPDPVIPPEPEVVLETKPEPHPEVRPEPVQAAPAQAEPAAQQVASLAPPSELTGTGMGAPLGFEETDGVEDEEILIVNPRFRTPPRPPAYPDRARDLDQEGVTKLRVKLDQRGDPMDVRVLDSSGYALLDHAAVKAVRKWQFQPAIHNGRPVAAFVELPIEFVLTEAR